MASPEADLRQVTLERLGEVSIDLYEQDISYIWGHVDERRSLLEIWAHVVEHSSRLAEALRRLLYDRAQLELAGLAFWVITFVAQARRSGHRQGVDRLIRVRSPLSDLIWMKYPRICPVCEKPTCICLSNLKEVEARHEGMNKDAIEQEKRQRRERVREKARN